MLPHLREARPPERGGPDPRLGEVDTVAEVEEDSVHNHFHAVCATMSEVSELEGSVPPFVPERGKMELPHLACANFSTFFFVTFGSILLATGSTIVTRVPHEKAKHAREQ